jgi:hypothetical protein
VAQALKSQSPATHFPIVQSASVLHFNVEGLGGHVPEARWCVGWGGGQERGVPLDEEEELEAGPAPAPLGEAEPVVGPNPAPPPPVPVVPAVPAVTCPVQAAAPSTATTTQPAQPCALMRQGVWQGACHASGSVEAEPDGAVRATVGAQIGTAFRSLCRARGEGRGEVLHGVDRHAARRWPVVGEEDERVAARAEGGNIAPRLPPPQRVEPSATRR